MNWMPRTLLAAIALLVAIGLPFQKARAQSAPSNRPAATSGTTGLPPQHKFDYRQRNDAEIAPHLINYNDLLLHGRLWPITSTYSSGSAPAVAGWQFVWAILGARVGSIAFPAGRAFVDGIFVATESSSDSRGWTYQLVSRDGVQHPRPLFVLIAARSPAPASSLDPSNFLADLPIPKLGADVLNVSETRVWRQDLPPNVDASSDAAVANLRFDARLGQFPLLVYCDPARAATCATEADNLLFRLASVRPALPVVRPRPSDGNVARATASSGQRPTAAQSQAEPPLKQGGDEAPATPVTVSRDPADAPTSGPGTDRREVVRPAPVMLFGRDGRQVRGYMARYEKDCAANREALPTELHRNATINEQGPIPLLRDGLPLDQPACLVIGRVAQESGSAQPDLYCLPNYLPLLGARFGEDVLNRVFEWRCPPRQTTVEVEFRVVPSDDIFAKDARMPSLIQMARPMSLNDIDRKLLRRLHFPISGSDIPAAARARNIPISVTLTLPQRDNFVDRARRNLVSDLGPSMGLRPDDVFRLEEARVDATGRIILTLVEQVVELRRLRLNALRPGGEIVRDCDAQLALNGARVLIPSRDGSFAAASPGGNIALQFGRPNQQAEQRYGLQNDNRLLVWPGLAPDAPHQAVELKLNDICAAQGRSVMLRPDAFTERGWNLEVARVEPRLLVVATPSRDDREVIRPADRMRVFWSELVRFTSHLDGMQPPPNRWGGAALVALGRGEVAVAEIVRQTAGTPLMSGERDVAEITDHLRTRMSGSGFSNGDAIRIANAGDQDRLLRQLANMQSAPDPRALARSVIVVAGSSLGGTPDDPICRMAANPGASLTAWLERFDMRLVLIDVGEPTQLDAGRNPVEVIDDTTGLQRCRIPPASRVRAYTIRADRLIESEARTAFVKIADDLKDFLGAGVDR